MATDRITWSLHRTGDGNNCVWSIWETECGRYRIDYNTATDKYVPMAVEKKITSGDVVEKHWNKIAKSRDTLDDAMAAINDYHCVAHDLVLA